MLYGGLFVSDFLLGQNNAACLCLRPWCSVTSFISCSKTNYKGILGLGDVCCIQILNGEWGWLSAGAMDSSSKCLEFESQQK